MSSKLTDKQKELITMPPGMDVIISVAGSGKTTVLSNRVAHLVRSGHCLPNQFLVFSYTKKASEEITKRVNHLLKLKKNEEGPIASTIHTFCKNEVCDYLGIENDIVLADSADVEAYEIELFNNLFNGELDKYFGDLHVLIKEFLNTSVVTNDQIANPLLQIINFDVDKVAKDEEAIGWKDKEEVRDFTNSLMSFMNTLIQRDDLPSELQYKNAREMASTFVHIMAEGITSYMTMNGIFTFDTMIASYLTITNVEKHPEYVVNLSNRFKHIIVDEFQDVKAMEMKAIHRLSTLIGSCTHAGDYAQTLYNDITQFMSNGAHANMYNTSIYSIHTMTKGFRVPDPICTVSNNLRDTIYRQIPLKLTQNNAMTPSGSPGTFDIKLVVPPYKMNREGIFNSIIDNFLNAYLPANGMKPDDSICFMNKTNNEVRTISKLISDTGNKVSVKYTYEKTNKRLSSLQIHVLYFLIQHGNEFSQFVASMCNKITETSNRINRIVDSYFDGIQNKRPSGIDIKQLEYLYRNSFGIIHYMIGEEMGISNTKSLIERNIANGLLTRDSAKNLFRIFEPFNEIVEQTKSKNPSKDGKIRIASKKITEQFKSNLFIRGMFTPSERPEAIKTIHKWKNKMEKASQFIISRNPRTLDDVIKYAHIYLSVKGKQDKVKIDKDISEFYINQTKKSVTKLFVRIPSIFRKRDDYLTSKTPLRGDFVKEALPVSKEKGVIVTDTIHSRKGLEYDHVAIVVPVIDPFPHARNLQSLCLEYVALTRAKKNCVIYFYTTQPGFNENSMISSNRVPFLDTMRYYLNQYKKFPENCFNQQLPDTGFDEELDISKDHYYHEKAFEEEGL